MRQACEWIEQAIGPCGEHAPQHHTCIESCEDKISGGALNALTCEVADGCKTPGLCEGMDVADAPAECVDACAAVAGDTCAEYPGGCIAACQGLYVGSGLRALRRRLQTRKGSTTRD